MSEGGADRSDDVQKLAVHREYGGFKIRDEVNEWMREQGCELAHQLPLPGERYDDGSKREEDGFRDANYPRGAEWRVCEHLIKAIEEGVCYLDVVEVPAGIEWVITAYDGAETVREQHRTFPSGEYAEGIAHSGEIDEVCSLHTSEEERHV